jgi:hypothetical protein
MKKTILNTLLAGAAIITASSVSTQAATLDTLIGNLQLNFSGWDAAQVSYDTSLTANNTFLCTTAATCDVASGTPAAPGASGTDDTYGIARVTAILDIDNFNAGVWSDGTDGDVLLAYFHGFTDEAVRKLSGFDTQLYSTGGAVDIFRIDAATFSGIDYSNQSTIDADLAALLGDLYLHLDFQAGCDAIETYATLCGDFNLTTQTGNSSGTAVATGGAALGQYPSEFFFTQDVVPCGTAFCATTSFNILVRGGEATTTKLPEPGTLGLLGLGLVGLGLAGRRRKA